MGTIRPPFCPLLNVGTVATPATGSYAVTEGGDSVNHITEIAVTDVLLIAPTAAANKLDGKLLYTFPAGNIVVKKSALNLTLDDVGTTCAADTPEVGLGTTVASGTAAAVLATTTENILEGGTCVAPKVDGTAATVGTDTTDLVIKAADAHTVYLNIGDNWAGADDGISATGKIILEWKYLD